MIDKGMLYNMGGWSQLFFFCFLAFSGYILALLLTLLCVDVKEIEHSVPAMRMAMAIQSICLFLVPALVFIFFCEKGYRVYLFSNGNVNISFWMLALLLIVFIQPFISSVGYYNQQLTLPDSLSAIEDWMRRNEVSAEKSMNFLFADKSGLGLLFNIIILAVFAGVGEELFFRGCLQQIIGKIVLNKHIAVWITAFIFSALHFQFYGFVPRFLLGALLGYLFIWSGNLFIPVLIHIVHNAITVIFTYFYWDTRIYEQFNNLDLSHNALLVSISFILSVLVLYALYRKRETELAV